MNTPIKSIERYQDQITQVITESGESFRAKHYISTCGGLETEKLLNPLIRKMDFELGRFSIVESISVFEGHPRDLGWKETVVFFNEDEEFYYEEPAEAVDLKSGVICMPENYGSYEALKTRKANYV